MNLKFKKILINNTVFFYLIKNINIYDNFLLNKKRFDEKEFKNKNRKKNEIKDMIFPI